MGTAAEQGSSQGTVDIGDIAGTAHNRGIVPVAGLGTCWVGIGPHNHNPESGMRTVYCSLDRRPTTLTGQPKIKTFCALLSPQKLSNAYAHTSAIQRRAA